MTSILFGQQVTNVDCCVDEVGTKATIIINNNNINPIIPIISTVKTLPNSLCNFKLTTAANTSAGIYNSTGNLIRTLWSGVRYDAGCYNLQWDGLLDDGTLAPIGSYTAKILSNNVQYTWEGVIGNTSNSLSYNLYHGFGQLNTITFAGNKGFTGQGFYEGETTENFFNPGVPNTRLDVNANVYAITADACSDGTNVYWLCADQYQNAHYIHATKASDNSEVSFVNQVTHNTGRGNQGNSTHLIGFRQEDNNYQYKGIAVNQNFIFATRTDNNTLYVIAKTGSSSGSILQTLNYPAPGRLAAGSANELWMITSNIDFANQYNAYINTNRLSGTFFSSGVYNGDQGNNEPKAADGDYNTRFQGTGGSQYLGIDLGSSKPVSSVSVYPATDGTQYATCTVQGSNTSQVDGYVTIGSLNEIIAGRYNTLNLPGASYRYIRLVKNDNFLLIAEMGVLSSAVSAPSQNQLTKYTVNANGTLSSPVITLNASNPLAVAISPDNSTVLVADGGISQQLKAYSNADGALLWTLGQQGGYQKNGAAVTNDKFMFSGWKTANGPYATVAVAYQADGSFWVNDIGNYRTQHYNADRSFKERIQFMPASRSTNADPNNPTSIFCDELEFSRDYTNPLDNGLNGSWELKNNWKIGTDIDVYGRFKQVVTLSNNHTYATSWNNNYIYDLRQPGAVYVGQTDGGLIEADGSLTSRSIINSGANAQITSRPLTGFDDSFMPQWASPVVIATTPAFVGGEPISYDNSTRGASTNNNKYFFFQQSSFPGYHLGGINKSATNSTWLWKASKSTFSKYYNNFDYKGDYPRDGTYDIGNNNGFKAQNSENCQALVQGKDIFWHVNAEAWKDGGQVNIWNHFSENGLFIGNFGKAYTDIGITGSTAGMAGNAYSGALVKVGSDYYIYHCDEHQHGGVHSWHVTGLNTIQEQTVNLIVSAPVTLSLDASNLMLGVPYRSSGFYGGSGWTVYPATGDPETDQYPRWVVNTSVRSWLPTDPDIAFYCDGASNTVDNNHYLQRDLGIVNTNNWSLSGQVLCDGATGSVYFEVLDNQGKILDQLILSYAALNNGVNVGQSSNINMKSFISDFQNYTLKNTNGLVTFQYANYSPVNVGLPLESGGNFNKPTTFRIRCFGSGGNKGIGSIKGLKFISK